MTRCPESMLGPHRFRLTRDAAGTVVSPALRTAAAVRDEDSTAAAVTLSAVPHDISECCFQQDTVVLPVIRTNERLGFRTGEKASRLEATVADLERIYGL